MPESVRVRRRLQGTKESPSERLLESRRMAENKVEMRHASRLILQHPDEQARPPILSPPLPSELPDRGGSRESRAHHHYPDPPAAAREIHRVLRPGGIYCVVDPGPAWFNAISAKFAKWSDPGWISFHTPDEFRALFTAAGFARTAWIDLLPGFGLAVGQKGGAG